MKADKIIKIENKKKLIANIAEMNKEISDNIRNLNLGGCGLFAEYYVEAVKPLVDYISIVPVVSYMDSKYKSRLSMIKHLKEEIKQNGKDNVNGWYGNLSAAHFVVKMFDEDNAIYFDGYEHWQIARKEIFKWRSAKGNGRYTLEQMKLSNEFGGWNSTYDRRQNEKLIQIIKKYTTI